MASEGKNSLCIFCLKNASSSPLEGSNDGNPNCSLSFLQLFQRYLKILPENKEIYKNWKDLVSCDSCFELGDKFCDLYFQWEALRLELEWSVRKVFDKMKYASGISSRLEAFQNQFLIENECENEVYNGIHVLRMDILEGCRKKLKSSFPKVVLTDFLEDLKEDEEELVGNYENLIEHSKPNDLLGGMMSHLAVILLGLPRQSELGPTFNNSYGERLPSEKNDKGVQTSVNFQIESEILPQNETENPEAQEQNLEVLETETVLNSNKLCDKNASFQGDSPEIPLIDLEMDNDSGSNPDVYEEQNLTPENTNLLDNSFENEMLNEDEALKASEAVTTLIIEPETPTPSSLGECEICHSTFNPAVLLTLHLRSEHGINAPYNCPQCNFKSLYRPSFRQHMRQIHNTVTGIPGPSQCSICQEQFSSFSALSVHFKRVHEKERDAFQCKTCFKFFETKTKLYAHTYHVHNQRRDGKIRKKVGRPRINPLIKVIIREVLRCHICQSRFRAREALATHARTVHQRILAYECVWCGTKLKTVEGFRSHMRFFHGKLFSSTNALMSADNVNFGFVQELPNQKNLPEPDGKEDANDSNSEPETIAVPPDSGVEENVAIETVTEEIPQKSLPEGSTTQFDFPAQRRYLHTKRPVTRQADKNSYAGKVYNCDFPLCNKSYKNKIIFDSHRRKHKGKKPFVCWARGCGLEFVKNLDLAWHYKRKHIDNNPNLPVITLGGSETEERTISSTPPPPTWKCSICQASFNLESDLAEHIKLEHKGGQLKLQEIQPVLKFACTPCGKEFGASGEFVYHMFSVHGKVLQALGGEEDVYEPEWKYVCPEFGCGLKCPTLEDLATHLKTHSEGNAQNKGGNQPSFEDIQVVQPGEALSNLVATPPEEIECDM